MSALALVDEPAPSGFFGYAVSASTTFRRERADAMRF
jgi:hypothetical protein